MVWYVCMYVCTCWFIYAFWIIAIARFQYVLMILYNILYICELEWLVLLPYIELGSPGFSIQNHMNWPGNGYHFLVPTVAKEHGWSMGKPWKTHVFEATRYMGQCWRNVSWDTIHHPMLDIMECHDIHCKWNDVYSTWVPMGAMGTIWGTIIQRQWIYQVLTVKYKLAQLWDDEWNN